MNRRRFIHREDSSKSIQLFVEDGVLVSISLRGNFRQKTAPLGSLESECKKVLGRGYIEVDEAGNVLARAAPTEPSLDALELRIGADPYGAFFEAKAALVAASEKNKVLTLLLRALDAIEADIDEHDAQNYNSYFPATDPEEPGYGALHAYREHYERLTRSPKKDGDWAFHVTED